MPITIITTYTIHQQYKTDIKDEHGDALQDTIRKTHKSHLILWIEDANVQLGNEGIQEPELNKIVGKNTIARNTGTGRGRRLHRMCQDKQTIPMNILKYRPKNTTPGKHEHYSGIRPGGGE